MKTEMGMNKLNSLVDPAEIALHIGNRKTFVTFYLTEIVLLSPPV